MNNTSSPVVERFLNLPSAMSKTMVPRANVRCTDSALFTSTTKELSSMVERLGRRETGRETGRSGDWLRDWSIRRLVGRLYRSRETG